MADAIDEAAVDLASEAAATEAMEAAGERESAES